MTNNHINDIEETTSEYYYENDLPIIGEHIIDMPIEIYQNGEIKKVNLSDYEGKWLILFFYPADFTFVCPTEIEDMAKHYKQLQDINTEVISISTDTVFSHKAWHDQSEAVGQVRFPMGADPTGKLTRAFGIYLPEEGLALRGTFIIDPNGILKAYEVNDNSIGRNVEETIRKVKAAQFVAKNGDKVCPANWQPGEDTLTPDVDLINKI